MLSSSAICLAVLCSAKYFFIIVTPVDSRKVYGRVDVLVTPINGSGEQWIDLARVRHEG